MLNKIDYKNSLKSKSWDVCIYLPTRILFERECHKIIIINTEITKRIW